MFKIIVHGVEVYSRCFKYTERFRIFGCYGEFTNISLLSETYQAIRDPSQTYQRPIGDPSETNMPDWRPQHASSETNMPNQRHIGDQHT